MQQGWTNPGFSGGHGISAPNFKESNPQIKGYNLEISNDISAGFLKNLTKRDNAEGSVKKFVSLVKNGSFLVRIKI